MEKVKFKFWDFTERKHIYSSECLQLSVTDIQSANKECEYKIYYKLTQEFKPPKNVYLIMGSVFHSVIENDLRFFTKRGIHYRWFDIEQYFNAVWEKEKSNCDFSKMNEQQAKLKAKNYIQVYYQKAIPFLYPLNQESIERFFSIQISYQDKKLRLTGKCDMVGKDLYIYDHKTASSLSEWDNGKADEDYQGYLYPYLFKNQGLDIRGFRYNVCSGMEVRPYEPKKSDSKTAEILQYAFAFKERLENNNLLRSKSEKNCRWCDYKNVCSECLIQKVEKC